MQDGTAALYGVDTIVEMTSMPGPKEARSLLERVAGMVRPIMVNRRWTCRRLCEFYPDNPGLLGMNANWGQRISLRRTPAAALVRRPRCRPSPGAAFRVRQSAPRARTPRFSHLTTSWARCCTSWPTWCAVAAAATVLLLIA